MSGSTDESYLAILTGYIQVCAKYKPKLGRGAKAGYELDEFQRIYYRTKTSRPVLDAECRKPD